MAASTKGSVVVTGASKGIGQACALHLDKLGFHVFASVRKEADRNTLQQRASERLAPIFLDVTDELSVQAAAETVAAAVGEAGLAGLVNNAGIAVAGPLEFLPIAEFRKQMEVNVLGQLAVIQAFLPLLREGCGRIVNIGSIAGQIAAPMTGAYAASKFALEGLTDALRMELEPWDIKVSLIQPGAVVTPMWDASIAAGDEILAKLPPRVLDLYGRAISTLRAHGTHVDKRGIAPEAVARAVEHALTAKGPKTRYLVARHAWVIPLLMLLPDRSRDRIILRRLQLGHRRGR